MQTMMATGLPSIISNARKILSSHSQHAKNQEGVPKGHVAVYVGESEAKRSMVPLTYLSHPLFQELLRHAEEEFGYIHPFEGLTIPCKEEVFINISKKMNSE